MSGNTPRQLPKFPSANHAARVEAEAATLRDTVMNDDDAPTSTKLHSNLTMRPVSASDQSITLLSDDRREQLLQYAYNSTGTKDPAQLAMAANNVQNPANAIRLLAASQWRTVDMSVDAFAQARETRNATNDTDGYINSLRDVKIEPTIARVAALEEQVKLLQEENKTIREENTVLWRAMALLARKMGLSMDELDGSVKTGGN